MPQPRNPRPRRLRRAAVSALLAVGSVAGVTAATSSQPANAELGYWYDTMIQGNYFHISQVDRRWGPLRMTGDEPIGRCGCQLTALASMLGFYAGFPAAPNQLTAMGFSAPLFPSTLVDISWLIELPGHRYRAVISTHNEPIFSPYYLDTLLGHGSGYEGGGGCGAAPLPYALEYSANPHLYTTGGGSFPLGPRGMGVDYISGFAKGIVDHNLSIGRPTIVGRHIPTTEGGLRRHVNIITGYDSEQGRYRFVDPVSETGSWSTTVYGNDTTANEAYAAWESSIVTTIDAYPVMDPMQHLVMSPEPPLSPNQRQAVPRADIELGAVLADGTVVGYDPATGEHHQFRGHYDYEVHPDTPLDDPDATIEDSVPAQGLMTTDVEPGTVRTRIAATTAGTYDVNVHDVRQGGAVDTSLLRATGTATAGQEIKQEVTYATDGSATAVTVADFSPEVVLDAITGTATEPVALDASDSFDADGRITDVAWDFGDGTTGTGPTPTHTWNRPGTYPVTVTVTAANGATATETVEATIAPTETDRPSVTITPNDGEWTNAASVEVTVHADDDGGSGIESLTTSVTGRPDQTTTADTATITVDAEGSTEVSALATDRMGNAEGSAFARINIDRTAPTATVQAPASTVRSLDFITGVAADGGSGVDDVEVQLTRTSDGRTWDGTDWTTADEWLDADGDAWWWLTDGLPIVTDGTFTVRARATDVAGNAGPASAPHTVTVSADAPVGVAGITELPPTLATTSSSATAVDADGHAYGNLTQLDLKDRALRWTDDGVPSELNPVPGYAGSHIDGASPDGTLAGWSTSNLGQSHATGWVDGQPVSLGSVVGGISEAHDVNDDGLFVGASAITSNRSRVRAASFEADGTARFLPDLGGDGSIALGVNASGTAVGYSYAPGSTAERPFVTNGTTATALGDYGVAYAINDAGDIVGMENGDAVVWRSNGAGPRQRVALGVGEARAIDASGARIVGNARDDETGLRSAVLWQDGQASDLNGLIDPSAGWHLEVANAISDDGTVVVGTGVHLGQRRGFRIVLTDDGAEPGEPPVTTATITPDTAWTNQPVTVALNATEGTTRIDVAGQPAAAGRNRTFVIDDEGTHQLAWAAVDAAGVVESPPGTATIRIDTTAPVATVGAPTGWSRTPVDLDVDATDVGGSGVASVTTDAGAGGTTISGDGTHTVGVVATDRAGNTSAPVTATVAIDGTGPTIELPNLDDEIELSSPLVVVASDATSGVAATRITVDGEEVEPNTPLGHPGPTTIQVKAIDVAGNVTVMTRTVTVEGDVEPEIPGPNTAPVADVGGPYVANVDQEVLFDGRRSTDADGDALTYSWYLDDAFVAEGSDPTLPIGINEVGTHTVRLVVNDGRTSSTSSTTFTVTQRAATALAASPVLLKLQGLLVYLGTFQARLTDAAGRPVAGEPVRFEVLGSTRCTAVTNANGTATCQARLGDALLAVLFPYTAVYDGDEARTASRAQARLIRS